MRLPEQLLMPQDKKPLNKRPLLLPKPELPKPKELKLLFKLKSWLLLRNSKKLRLLKLQLSKPKLTD